MMRTVARPVVFAWHFLTAIPLSRTHHEPTPAELATSMAWYPVIGVVIGSTLVVTDLVLSTVFAAEVVNVLLILILVVLTRGLHQDGLADTLDGLAGGKTPADRLTIMRDPRIGAIGATGLMLSFMLRYAGFMALPQSIRIPALLCMPAVGRWAMVVLAWSSPYARTEGGLAAPFLSNLSRIHVAVATGLLVVITSLALGPLSALVTVVWGAMLVVMLWAGCRAYFGGITGDTLGATNEIVEISFLLLVPLLLVMS